MSRITTGFNPPVLTRWIGSLRKILRGSFLTPKWVNLTLEIPLFFLTYPVSSFLAASTHNCPYLCPPHFTGHHSFLPRKWEQDLSLCFMSCSPPVLHRTQKSLSPLPPLFFFGCLMSELFNSLVKSLDPNLSFSHPHTISPLLCLSRITCSNSVWNQSYIQIANWSAWMWYRILLLSKHKVDRRHTKGIYIIAIFTN